MGRREEVLAALKAAGRPLDDDELAAAIAANRHYVNALCRNLAAEGLIRRYPGDSGKYVNRLTAQDLGEEPDVALPPPPPSADKRMKRQERARRNAEALIAEFDESVRRFEASNAFLGPSLYFHERALERRRKHNSIAQLFGDNLFWEYVYAMLPAWGMHRIGPQAAKVGDFNDMVLSFREQQEAITSLADQRITAVSLGDEADLAQQIWDVVNGLRVSTSRSRIVAGSKALHHVLPKLVPPIDRQYTFRFFTGQPSVQHGERQPFLEWFPILCEIGRRAQPAILAALQRDGFMATSEAKVIDNAIIGFMQMRGLRR